MAEFHVMEWRASSGDRRMEVCLTHESELLRALKMVGVGSGGMPGGTHCEVCDLGYWPRFIAGRTVALKGDHMTADLEPLGGPLVTVEKADLDWLLDMLYRAYQPSDLDQAQRDLLYRCEAAQRACSTPRSTTTEEAP